MLVRRLSLHEFRNYRSLGQEFSPSLNLLIGRNAQGKSNLLEALYLLATTKSMRGSKDQDLIRWDSPACLVRGEVLRQTAGDVDLDVCLSRTERKSLAVNGVRTPRSMDFIGQLKAVVFCTGDLETVRGEPALRRRFLDLEIAQLSPAYCHALAWYRKVLEQRNRLLKNLRDQPAGELEGDSLATWTEQLAAYGSRLMERRASFLERLRVLAREVHSELTGGEETLDVRYEPSFPLPPEGKDLAEAFRQALAPLRREELRRQVTLLGPHRDELLLLVNGREARVFGSQGQQRTVALSLKLAELRLMTEVSGETPICLLDDVFSELDAVRRSHLVGATLDRCQTFLTTTDRELLPPELRDRGETYRVEEGLLERIAGPGTEQAATG